MEASDITQIVYELIRISGDRNSMLHEDTVSQYISAISALKARNKRLSYQLKDLYKKYEKAIPNFTDNNATLTDQRTKKSVDILTKMSSSPRINSFSPSSSNFVASALPPSSFSCLENVIPIIRHESNSLRFHNPLRNMNDARESRTALASRNCVNMDHTGNFYNEMMNGHTGLLRDWEVQNRLLIPLATGTAASPLCIDDIYDSPRCSSAAAMPLPYFAPASSPSSSTSYSNNPSVKPNLIAIPMVIDTGSNDGNSTRFNMGIDGMCKDQHPNGNDEQLRKNVEATVDEHSEAMIEDIDATYFNQDELEISNNVLVVDEEGTRKNVELSFVRDLADLPAIKSIQHIDTKETEIAICGPDREREDHCAMTMKSHLLSVKQKASLQKWLEILNLGISGPMCPSKVFINDIVRHLPLSHADVAQIKWNGGQPTEIVAEALLQSLRTFFEVNDLTHLFPMTTFSHDGGFLVKGGAKNKSKDVDIFVDIGETSMDCETGNKQTANISLKVLSSIGGGRLEGVLALARGNTDQNGNVSITSASTNKVAGIYSSSESDSTNRLKRSKTTSGYRGISSKENMHVNVRQPVIFRNTLVKPDANIFNKPAANVQTVPDDNKGASRGEQVSVSQRLNKRRMTVHETPVSRPAPVDSSPIPGVKGGRVVRCVEVVRKKSEREALRGHQCSECGPYYTALMQQGILSEENMEEMLRNCSRHKARWSPPRTPEGFWDLTVRTPEKWE